VGRPQLREPMRNERMIDDVQRHAEPGG